MLLGDLTQDLTALFPGSVYGPDIEITGLCCDSRQVQPGELFFALPGSRDDGSRYVSDALARGAAAAIVPVTAPEISAPQPILRVTDAALALAIVAAEFIGHPSATLRMVGITGTNGKTTITYLLERLWGAATTGVIGTINIRWGGRPPLPTSHTTPDAIALQRTLAAMEKDGIRTVALEVSSHALQQRRADAVDFDAAVFTNLTQDHLDYHRDMEEYYLVKRRLFTDCLRYSRKAAKRAVINADDPFGTRLIADCRGLPFEIMTFSLKKNDADLRVKEFYSDLTGTTGTLRHHGRDVPFRTDLLGAHNLQNIMAAVLAAGVEEKLPETLERLATARVPGRLERVPDRQGRHVFVDYAHTPDALQNVLAALNAVRHADPIKPAVRLVTVFGCGGDRDRTKRPLMGAAVAQAADVIIVTSDNPRTEDPDKIIADILPGVSAGTTPWNGRTGYLVEKDRRAALHLAIEIARPGDVVLVAGKGHEDYQIIGTVKTPFDDAQVLRGLLG
jgi:UDP-N-acetylmuramoyl-L-alanyl-D-glutamate--2,6-diaminopimelate ligase